MKRPESEYIKVSSQGSQTPLTAVHSLRSNQTDLAAEACALDECENAADKCVLTGEEIGASALDSYEDTVFLASWLNDGSGAVVKNTFGSGAIYSFGFAYGYSYCAKDIPHVPLSEKNNELYPVQLAKTNILEQIFQEHHIPQNSFRGKGIETAHFDNCTLVINHTPHPVDLSPVSGAGNRFVYQYEIGRPILLPHAAVAIFDRG